MQLTFGQSQCPSEIRPATSIIQSELCDPSQNGGLPVRLHPQKACSSSSVASQITGLESVSLCDPSQNGWFVDIAHEHHA